MMEKAITGGSELEAFVASARSWVSENLAPVTQEFLDEQVHGDGSRALALQRTLFEAGYAGIAWPKEYGGRGLSPSFQVAFNSVVQGREMPTALNMTLGMIGPTLLELGTEEQKATYVNEILRGEAIWCQLLSEPSGGSDLAGVLTQAERDGDCFRLTGAKTWTSSAFRAHRGLCLARTDPDVPKHSGLTMFIVDMSDPRIDIRRIRKSDGDELFCEEHLDGVIVRADDVVGEVNRGWTVAMALLGNERAALGGSSPFLSGPGYRVQHAADNEDPLLSFVREHGLTSDPVVRQLVAEAHVNRRVAQALSEQIREGVQRGSLPPTAGAIGRLVAATTHVRQNQIEMAVQGPYAAILRDSSSVTHVSNRFLVRQAACLGGGSVEMQRNIISERILGLPREFAPDKDRPFSEVRHNRAPIRSRE